jgi:aryl-alcohol dehydrogenase-like predicted oxidoreductase
MPTFHPRRILGRTGFHATRLGVGDLADRAIPIETCVATLRRALDAGLNVVDTAPGYEDGYSEQIVGRAVHGRREHVFVIDKIDDLASPVTPQIDASLERLGLASSDAFVLHSVSSPEAFRRLAARGGAFDEMAECIAEGKMRFRGISSHDPDVLRAALEADLCDVVMFPLGPFVDPRYVDAILPLARRKHAGTVCFKTFGAGKLVGDTTGYNQPLKARPRGKVSSGGSSASVAALPRLAVRDCVHYTLTLDPDVALLGLSFPNEQDEAFAAALDFEPLSDERMEQIRASAAKARKEKGPCWWNPEPNL